jgi:starch phosphorylase
MKSSIATGLGFFSSARMVGDYNRKFYTPATHAFKNLTAGNAAEARGLVEAKKRLVENFDGGKLYISNPVVNGTLKDLHIGDKISVSVEVNLGNLSPAEVEVDAYSGSANAHNELVDSVVTPLAMLEDRGNGRYLYGGEIECGIAGRFGLTARIKAAGDAWDNSVPGFMCWPR